MDQVHESGPWTRSKMGVHGPLVHVLTSPLVITLYAHQNHQLLLARFFSAKLRKYQVTWLPCEVEALAIASAIRHCPVLCPVPTYNRISYRQYT